MKSNVFNNIRKQIYAKKSMTNGLIIAMLVIGVSISAFLIIPSEIINAESGDIDSVVDTWKYCSTSSKIYSQKSIIRINDTDVYAICYCGEDDDGFVETFKQWGSNGTIQESIIDTLEYDNTDGLYSNIEHIPGTDKYVVAYDDTDIDKISLVTVSINEEGEISNAVIDSQASSIGGSHVFLHRFTDNIYMIAIMDGSNNGIIESWWIDDNGVINNTVLDSENQESSYCYMPYVCSVDSDTIAITYATSSNGGVTALRTLNVTNGVFSAGDYWEFNAAAYRYSCINMVGTNVFALTYITTDKELKTGTVTIADSGNITKSFIDTLEIVDADAALFASTFFVDDPNILTDGVMGCTIRGIGSSEEDGYLYTWNVSDTGTLGDSIVDSIEYNATIYAYSDVVYLSDNNYSVVFSSKTYAGYVSIIEIETEQETDDSSTFQIKGLSNNRVTWSGLAGSTVWCNGTGENNEWLEINLSVNSSFNVTEIRVFVDDMNDTTAWINASNITLYVSNSSNITYYSFGSFDDGGSNISINKTEWDTYISVDNPFNGSGITNMSTSIFVIFKLVIPDTAPEDTFWSADSESFHIYVGGSQV